MIQSETARNDVKTGNPRRVGRSRGLDNLPNGHYWIEFRQLSNLSLGRFTVTRNHQDGLLDLEHRDSAFKPATLGAIEGNVDSWLCIA